MIDRLVDIIDELINVCSSEDGDILVDSSFRMLKKAVKYQKMLRAIDVETKSFQKKVNSILTIVMISTHLSMLLSKRWPLLRHPSTYEILQLFYKKPRMLVLSYKKSE